jgi:hypothetical protein
MASSSHPSQPAEARPLATAVAVARRVNRLSAHVCPTSRAAAPVVAAAAAATAVAAAPLHPLFQGRPNLMLVPIATPLLPLDEAAKPAPATARRRLDVPSLERYVQHLYGEGYEGIYVGGSSGEGYHMEEALRMELCEAAVEASRGSGKIVMVHVGAAKSAEAIRLAAHAAAAGADCIAAIPPYVGSPVPTFAEVVAFYTELATATAPTPVVCYNIPGLTGAPLSVAQLTTLMNSHPGVVGIKYSDSDMASLLSLTGACPDKVGCL